MTYLVLVALVMACGVLWMVAGALEAWSWNPRAHRRQVVKGNRHA